MIYLSIIIPVRNEERFICDTLKNLAGQDYSRERFELLIVDGRSEDGTRAVVERFISENPEVNVRLLDNPRYLSSSARNMGIRAAQGRLIAVIDGHVYIPGNQLFKNMENLKERNGGLCLARPAPLDAPALLIGKPVWIAVARKSWLGHSRKSYIYSNYEGFVDPVSSGFAYDRCVFDRVGYFDESFDAAEDVEFNFRLKKAGILAYTSAKFLIYSYPRDSLRALLIQQIRYGEGRALFVRKHPEGLSKETMIPAGIFILFACAPLAAAFISIFPLLFLTFASLLCIYWAVLLATGVKEALKRKRLIGGVWIGLAIWVTHMGLGWGLLKAILKAK